MTQSGSETAQAYREGFYEGAQAVVKALGDDLPENQLRVLERWVDGPLAEWKHTGEDERKPPTPLLDGA